MLKTIEFVLVTVSVLVFLGLMISRPSRRRSLEAAALIEDRPPIGSQKPEGK